MDEGSGELPISSAKAEIRLLLSRYSFVVVVGDTGSGKTTQVPSYLLDWEDTSEERYSPVAVTQPRRVAATSVSARVASNRGVKLGGDEVGYKVRFDDRTPKGRSRCTFMTDGVLVRECVGDPLLSRYKTIMLDEAHERSVETDVLFGLVKQAVAARRDLKCLIASATLDAERFSNYFENCPVVRVPGRAYPVDVYHSKTTQSMTRFGPASRSYVDKAVEVAAQIHETQPLPGHVLIFLTGQDEIERACSALRQRFLNDSLVVLPLYGALPMDAAERVFDEVDAQKIRKVVFATNVAETSITVPGVRYVVDAGYVKLKGFEPRRAVASLTVVPISKVAAEQRAGRAGRTGPGQCYRLYSKDSFDNMQPETIPEIKRTSMAAVALSLKSLKVKDVLRFDFLDPPDAAQLACALIELHAIGAIDTSTGDLKPLGRCIASLALEPNLARALVEAAHLEQAISKRRRTRVRSTILGACALLSSEDVWFNPHKKRRPSFKQEQDDDSKDDETRAKHMAFRHERGDLFSLANVFHAFLAVDRNHHAALAWCELHSLRYRALRFARKAADQLDSELESFVEPKLKNIDLDDPSSDEDDDDLAARAITYGLCLNAAERGMHKDAFVLLPGPGATLDAQLDEFPGLLEEDDNQILRPPSVALVRVDDDTQAAFKTTPQAFVFHELKVPSNARGSFAHNLVVVDVNILNNARRHLGHANVRDLCGRPPLKKKIKREDFLRPPRGEEGNHQKKIRIDPSSPAQVDAARLRFLERKKRKNNTKK